MTSKKVAKARLVSRGTMHQALREVHGRASPEATRVLTDALERIADALIQRSHALARDERRLTVLERHALAAFSEFMFPKQGLSRAAQALREALEDVDQLVRLAPSEFRPSPSSDDDEPEPEAAG